MAGFASGGGTTAPQAQTATGMLHSNGVMQSMPGGLGPATNLPTCGTNGLVGIGGCAGSANSLGSSGLPGLGTGGSVAAASGAMTNSSVGGNASMGAGGGGGGSGAGLTEKLALKFALQNASTGTMGFLGGNAQQRTAQGGAFNGRASGFNNNNSGQAPFVARNFRTVLCRYYAAGKYLTLSRTGAFCLLCVFSWVHACEVPRSALRVMPFPGIRTRADCSKYPVQAPARMVTVARFYTRAKRACLIRAVQHRRKVPPLSRVRSRAACLAARLVRSRVRIYPV